MSDWLDVRKPRLIGFPTPSKNPYAYQRGVSLVLANGGEDVQEVAGRAGKAVEPRHRQHVARVELVEQPAKLGAIGLGSARCLLKHAHGSGGGERLHLRPHGLPVRRYPRVAINHAAIMQQIYAAGKCNAFSILFSLRFS